MEADGHVQPLGLLVQREEVRVGAPLVRFQIALLQDAARAVVLGETQLLQRSLDVAGGRYAYPAQPTVRLCAAVCKPPVVAARDCELRLRRVRRLHEEERRIDDLRLRAQFVHVAQATSPRPAAHALPAVSRSCRRRGCVDACACRPPASSARVGGSDRGWQGNCVVGLYAAHSGAMNSHVPSVSSTCVSLSMTRNCSAMVRLRPVRRSIAASRRVGGGGLRGGRGVRGRWPMYYSKRSEWVPVRTRSNVSSPCSQMREA